MESGEPKHALMGRYEFQEELGQGGMGRIWRAYDTHLNRYAAVKEILLAPGLTEQERSHLAARARREAQATAMGSHPHIVTVYDVVEVQGRPWIVMEYLSGCSLHALVEQQGPCAPEQTAAWGRDVLSALAAAHGQGITHRDVKPENVMVTDDGRVVLTDFGIAAIADNTGATQTVGVVGSPAYMAPERLAAHPASAASDLWSLGATLYYTATGRSPFLRADLPATLHAVTTAPLPEVPVSGELGAAISGMLVRDLHQRIDAARAHQMLCAAAGTLVGEDDTEVIEGAAPTRLLAGPGPEPIPTPPAVSHPGPPASAGAPDVGTSPQPPSASPRPEPHRTRLSWPVVALSLALALAVGGLVALIGPFGGESAQVSSHDQTAPAAEEEEEDQGGGEDQGGDQTHTQEEQEGGSEAEPSPQSGDEQEAETGEPFIEDMTWSQDPAGFEVLVPRGWTRSVEGESTYYTSPDGDSYLQIDETEHPTDDQYAHAMDRDRGASSGGMSNYERVLVADRTDSYGYHSVADWEFTWQNEEGQMRQVLSRGITVAPGEHITIAWASPEQEWVAQNDIRVEAMDSFIP